MLKEIRKCHFQHVEPVIKIAITGQPCHALRKDAREINEGNAARSPEYMLVRAALLHTQVLDSTVR